MTLPQTGGMRRRLFVAVVIVMALLAACGDDEPSRSEAGEASSSSTSTTAPATTTATPAATTASTAVPATADPCTLEPQAPPTATLTATNATDLAFAPDGRLFFAERSGTVRVFQDGATKEFAKVPTVTTEQGGGYSERGLLGLAISPNFAADHFVYAFVSNPDRKNQDIVRWTDCAGTGRAFTTLVRCRPATTAATRAGGSPSAPTASCTPRSARSTCRPPPRTPRIPRGKVLRYNADGTVPADNPFGAGNPVWAFGFRNPFGLAISPTGQMAVTSNGPSGDAGSPATGFDVVFADVKAGTGYQWPACYGYSHPLPGQTGCGAGQVEPTWSSEATTVIPTGAAFIDASGPAGLAGHLVFCNYNGGMLVLTAGTPHATVTKGPAECKLDVTQGPDHAVYYSDSGHIYRR